MNLKEAQERAFKINLDNAKKAEKEIALLYKKAYQDILSELKVLYKQIEKVDPKDYYNYTIKIRRLEKMQKEIVLTINNTYPDIMNQVRLNSLKSFTNQYYMDQYIMDWFSIKDFTFTFVNKTAANVSTWWTSDVWKRIKEDAQKAGQYKGYVPKWGNQGTTLKKLLLTNKSKQIKWIKNSVSNGLIQGKSVAQTARLMQNAFDQSYRNSIRVARTETIRNLNAASYLNNQNLRSQGILINRMWLAVHDTRTRLQSAMMDGQLADPVSGMFTYPNGAQGLFPGQSGYPFYDINERCTTIEVLEGQPPELRRAKNPITGKSEVMSFRNFKDYQEEHGLIYTNGSWAPKK
ncbi:MAG: phage minor head protein [Candidatus Hodarchaeota archaeon]